MRISDWSSDVCSSDLRAYPSPPPPLFRTALFPQLPPAAPSLGDAQRRHFRDPVHVRPARNPASDRRSAPRDMLRRHDALGHALIRRRSEEHTSDLQSLMRISYAGFSLKKNITRNKATAVPEK